MTTLANNSRSSAINAGKYTKAKRDEYLPVVSINVNGLKSKLKAPGFEEYIAAHDIVTLSETKHNCLDNLLGIRGFDIFSNTRKNCKTITEGQDKLQSTKRSDQNIVRPKWNPSLKQKYIYNLDESRINKIHLWWLYHLTSKYITKI